MPELLDAAGKPIVPEVKPDVVIPEGHVLIKQEDWEGVGKRLDFLERPVVEAPAAPVAPAGPSVDEQVVGMDKELGSLGKQIDEAIKEEKPISELLAKRDAVAAKRNEVVTDAKVGTVMNQGLETLQHLTTEVTASKMPHLGIVRTEYDTILANMPQEHKASLKAQMAAYDLAVGRNMDKILASEKEKFQREDLTNTQDVTEHTGRDTGGGDETPSFEEYIGSEGMLALKAASRTPEEYVKRLGHKNPEAFVEAAIKQEQEMEGEEVA